MLIPALTPHCSLTDAYSLLPAAYCLLPMMVFGWLRRRRRKQLCSQPFPCEWVEILQRNVYDYAGLSESEQAKLRDDLRVLVAEKNWEGHGGLELNDEVRVTIAAQAALLLLGFRDEYFNMLKSILVYPGAYVAPSRTVGRGGLVLEGESDLEGQAWYRGPVILSWADTLAGCRHKTEGANVVLHEFAHQLDMQNGRVVDGIPPLSSRTQYDRWQRVLKSEYDRLVRDCRRHRRTVLNCYGATDTAEFFAVATEAFFERSLEMKQRHPELYEIFRDFYRQDPAMRLA